jgi:hypothetical protein
VDEDEVDEDDELQNQMINLKIFMDLLMKRLLKWRKKEKHL